MLSAIVIITGYNVEKINFENLGAGGNNNIKTDLKNWIGMRGMDSSGPGW